MDMKALLQVFLEEGANPAALNGSRETAIHIACSSQRQGARENRARSEVLEILLRSLPGQENLRNKGAKSIPRLTKWLEMKDSSHNTPLHLAATSGLLDCVEVSTLFINSIT
jgi:ankyrin repeat protein